MEIIPIVQPQIDWTAYLMTAQKVLGVSISMDFDRAKIQPSALAFVVSANTLNQQTPASDIDVPATRHLSYAFLLIALSDSYHDLIEETSLNLTSSETARPGFRIAIVSGNLEQWKQAVVSCSNSENPDVRVFADKIRQYFESIRLGGLWTHYTKTKSKDQTLKLEYKK